MHLLRREGTLLAFAMGVVAPFLWVESLGYWGLYVIFPLIKSAWRYLSLKGMWITTVSDVVLALLVGLTFAIVLRVSTGREWRTASTAFISGFVFATLFSAFISDIEWDLELAAAHAAMVLPVDLVLLATVTGCLAWLSRNNRFAGA